jgi:hypothetical protein
MIMRRILAAGLLPALLAAQPSHADTIVVGPEQRASIGLTVYSQESLAVVRDVRHVTLPAGESVLRFTGVPEQLDPRTLALRAEAGAPALRVHEQTFRYDLANAQQLLTRWLGKRVELVETDEQLATKVTDAELLALTPGMPSPQPIFKVGDRLLIGHPGRIQLPPLEGELFLTPTVSWTVTCAGTGPRDLEASYATSGLGWEADYTLALERTTSPTKARLTGWITVRNDTDGAFERATLALVAGRINRATAPVPKLAYAMRAEAADMAGAPAEEQLLDYHHYALPDPITLAANETKQVPLLAADGAEVERHYRVTGPGLWVGASPSDDEQTLPVQIRLTIRNDRGHGLGKPLPAGIVRVEAPTPSGTVEFVGEDRVGHAAENEVIDLQIGEASDLVAKRRQTDYQETGTKPYEAEASVLLTLRNHTDDAARIEVREPLSGAWKVLESSLEAERVNATTLGFTATVPAKGSVEIRYRVQLGR